MRGSNSARTDGAGNGGFLLRFCLAGAAGLLLIAALAWLLGERTALRMRGELMDTAVRSWDAVLTAHYAQYGDWSHLPDLVPALPGGTGLTVFNATGNAVFSAGTAVPGAPARPLLLNGEKIGAFVLHLGPAPAAARASAAVPALALLAGGALFLAGCTLAAGSALSAERRRAAAQAAELEALRTKVQRLERVRSSMIADVAHELRNPLATLRAVTENALASGSPLPPERLAALHDEIYRMSKLVGDLNQLALAESGHLRLEKAWFSLAELLQNTLEAMRPEAEERGLALEWSDAAVSPLLFADRMRLQQVFVNLLSNALRHARSRISVRLCDAEGGAALAASVEDDGQGIDEDDLPHIFDRFYRSRQRSGGSGLGLAIVREFVRAHGGRVEVQSRWGEGTTFTVRLPVFRE